MKKAITGTTFKNMKKSIITFTLCTIGTLSGIVGAQGQDYRLSSGTGFFISRDGYLITNYHVIKNPKGIGITQNFETIYDVTIVATDVINDIAILQIRDPEFKQLPNPIPYTLKSSLAQQGDDCFTIGYPLIEAMGKEPKLTKGIISALTGFHGNESQYQITATAFGGNSGGPLFDKQGNIIGVVSATLGNRETVTYAVKTNSILNLINSLPNKPALPRTNKISRKSLPLQVSQIRDFVCFIVVARPYPYSLQEEISTNPTYSFDNGKYKGEDREKGMGAYLWNTGSVYLGYFKENTRNGYGVYLPEETISNCPNAKYYAGNWSNNEKSGIGACYDGDGKLIYRGEFKDGKPQGRYPSPGNYSSYRFEFKEFDNGSRYVGETKEGKINGFGVTVYKEGGMWFGAWKDGLREGQGILIKKDGTTQSGTWRGDKFTPVSTVVQSIQSTQNIQNTQSTQNTSGQIEKVWVDYNAVQDNQNGIKIHVKFSVQGMQHKQGLCAAWFYYDSGEKLVLTEHNGAYTTASKQVSVADDFTPGYENTIYEDFVLFIPFSAFPRLGNGKFGFKFYVGIMDSNNKQLARSEDIGFALSW